MKNDILELSFFELEQSVGVFYATTIKAQDLLRICKFDFRSIKENGGVKKFLGIQRPLNEKRVDEIRRFIATEDGSFPTSIVISVDERCARIIDESGKPKLVLSASLDSDAGDSLIPFDAIATIIDGQHRLKAFLDTEYNWDLSVNIFVGVDEGTRAMLFSKVNLAQTKVNKSLAYDLFSLDRDRSPEKTCHELVVNLNDIENSPFHHLIKRLGSATEGVFGETLSQATVVRGILPLITRDPIGDRDIGRRSGLFPDRGAKDFSNRIFYPFFRADEDHKILAILINYYSAIKERWPSAWANNGRGSVLPKTNGFDGTIRFLRDAYLHLTTRPDVPSKEAFLKILLRSSLSDSDFTTDRFPPGTSGSAAIYRELTKTIQMQTDQADLWS